MQTPKGSLQSGACVLVHPTQRSRDLDSETKRHNSFIRSVDSGRCRNLQSCRSRRRWLIELNYNLPYSIHLSWPITLVRIGAQFWGTQSRVTLL